MVAATTAQQVADAVRPGVENAGLFLEDVTIAPAGSRTVIRVIVDLPEDVSGALDLDQVAEVARVISDTIDDTDVYRGAYTLEVTSPGTSRPLTELRHFKRARSRLVQVDLHEGAPFTARLIEVADGELVFEDDRRVPLDAVRRGMVEVELKRANALADADFVDFEGSDDSDPMDGEG